MANARITMVVTLWLTTAAAFAQSTGGPYTLRKQVIAGGGNRAAAAPYVATVTLAQPLASSPQTGGTYRVTGGFHGPRAEPLPRIFCDGFEAAPCP